MIHFLPDTESAHELCPYDEAVARLAGIRTALTIAEQAVGVKCERVAGGIPADWSGKSAAKQRRADQRSVESAQAAAAGLEMLAEQRAAGLTPHPKSLARLADTLRAELQELDRLFSL